MQFHLQSNLGSYFLCTGALASQNTLKGWGGDTDLHQFLVERKNSGILGVAWKKCSAYNGGAALVYFYQNLGKKYLRPPEHVITEQVLYVPWACLDHDSLWGTMKFKLAY